MSFPLLPHLTKRQLAASKQAGKRRRQEIRAGPGVESLEQRCLLSTVRTITGFGNNIDQPTFGEAGTDLLRVSPVKYADRISSPSLPQDPSARVISNVLNDQTDPNNPSQDLSTVDQNSLSAYGYVWGQFIDHDMDLTLDNSGQSFPIAVPPGDPIGPGPLPFTRSNFDANTGTSARNPRQQINSITSFLNLSQVYGSDAATAGALRTHAGGKLKTSAGGELPYDNTNFFTPQQLAAINQAEGGMQNPGPVPTSNIFVTGDIRGNENLELTALQTLFVRNHNRIAAQMQALNPSWTDEQLYQEARKLNIAEEEIITYTAYLPDLLGPAAMPTNLSYDPAVNPSIATEFSTVAFRFGHSLLSNDIERHGNDGLDIADVSPDGAAIHLSEDFFDANLINPNGVTDPITGHTSSDIDAVLKGIADNNANALDLMAIRSVRNLLLADGNVVDQDLIARDIQRARDHGIGSLNDVRAGLGLPRYTSFAQITSDIAVQQKLKLLYGNVNNIDVFEGGLAENHVPGSDMGQTFTAILVDQFTRLAKGDRFFYLHENFTPAEQAILSQGNTLAKVLKANTGITNLQGDVFKFTASIEGTVFSDPDKDGGHLDRTDGESGLVGVTVQLKNDSGSVVATTTTDSHGHYKFNQFSGLSGTGNFTVSLVVPSGFVQTTPNPGTITISRGGFDGDGVDFGLTINFSTPSGSAFAANLSGPKVAPAPADSGSQSLLGTSKPVPVPQPTISATQPAERQLSGQDSGLGKTVHNPVKNDVSDTAQVFADIAWDQMLAPL
jgi:peroxidase